jgi:hypothetical protein
VVSGPKVFLIGDEIELTRLAGIRVAQGAQTSPQEIAGLFAVADRDLKACQTPDLGSDGQFNIAYNAALQVATPLWPPPGTKPIVPAITTA